jgi:hypothetical protein
MIVERFPSHVGTAAPGCTAAQMYRAAASLLA